MAEKKVVVQVLADTKPFIQSIMKLRKFAESVDSAQIRASNKVLKNLVQNAKINQKIQKITQKTAKLQQKVNKENEDSQEKVLKSAIKYGIVLDTIRRSFRLMKSGFMNGYEFGRGVVDPARTYGVDLTKATQANALYSAFGGKAGGGADVMAKFLQAQNEFRTTQTGPLKEAAGLFGLNPQTLMKGDLLDFIKETRNIVKSRNLSEGTTQMMLQKLGLGYDAAIMRMVTESDVDFNKKLSEMVNAAQSNEETLKAVEDTEKSFETMMTNIKTKFMEWSTYLKPVIDGFNELGPATEALVASVVSAAGALGGVSLLKGFFGSKGTAAASSSLAGGALSLSSLGVASLYVGTAVIGGMVGKSWADSAADSKRKLESGQKMSYWEHFGHYMNSLVADSAYDFADMLSGVYEDRKAEQYARLGKTNNGGSPVYNINVQAPLYSDPYTYGERVGQSFNNITSGNNFFLNGSNP